jgi:hypothetical protein
MFDARRYPETSAGNLARAARPLTTFFVDANHDGETAESDFCVLVLLNPLGVNRNLYFLNLVCLFFFYFRLFFVS